MMPKFVRDDLQKVFIEGVESSSPSASKASNEKADSASKQHSEEKSVSLLESSKTATAISSGVAVIESDTKL